MWQIYFRIEIIRTHQCFSVYLYKAHDLLETQTKRRCMVEEGGSLGQPTCNFCNYHGIIIKLQLQGNRVAGWPVLGGLFRERYFATENRGKPWRLFTNTTIVFQTKQTFMIYVIHYCQYWTTFNIFIYNFKTTTTSYYRINVGHPLINN